MVKAQRTARESEGSGSVWWKFIRNEGSMGEEERWFVSCETSSDGSSYGSKISEMVSSTPIGSVAVRSWVSLSVARYDSL